MSLEDVRQDLDRAMDRAIVGNVDLDDLEHELEKRLERVADLRTAREGR